MNIVWFKKDLRVSDHQPLAQALKLGPTVGLFIFEPTWFSSAEFDISHLKFVIETLEELQTDLAQKGIPLLIRYGSAVEVFASLLSKHRIHHIYSHQETGLQWTYQRDLDMLAWARSEGIPWHEFKQFGVVRKLKDRETWTQKRSAIIERPLISVDAQRSLKSPWETQGLPYDKLRGQSLKPLAQKGGRIISEKFLNTFIAERGEAYFSSLSSPVKAFRGCSRISPYLSWGVLSVTEVHHAIERKKRELKLRPISSELSWNRSLQQFENRLSWRCHFVQKLESEPEIEFENFNREFDGLRESEFDEAKFQAWCRGETGYPLIDACMRALHQHGWINFRMRAMLMSFATYQLWLHWKKPAEYLARQFLDFEPGIHYSQAQMQSGVTGINTIRIYSPRKQVLDQDPTGVFIKKYVPELKDVPISDLAEPHLMPPLLQIDSGFKVGSTYPAPIVDPVESYNQAKKRIFEWKNRSEVQALSKKVLAKHASRSHKNFHQQARGPKK